ALDQCPDMAEQRRWGSGIIRPRFIQPGAYLGATEGAREFYVPSGVVATRASTQGDLGAGEPEILGIEIDRRQVVHLALVDVRHPVDTGEIRDLGGLTDREFSFHFQMLTHIPTPCSNHRVRRAGTGAVPGDMPDEVLCFNTTLENSPGYHRYSASSDR